MVGSDWQAFVHDSIVELGYELVLAANVIVEVKALSDPVSLYM